MPANMNDRYEGGAHLTFFDREYQTSFTYYDGDNFVKVAFGGYGERPALNLPVPRLWRDGNSASPTIFEFEQFCRDHIIDGGVPF